MKPVLLVVVVGMAWVGCSPAPVTQPLGFNHKKHIEADMECISCHGQVEEKAIASFPTVEKCMECHEETHGTNPDEPKLQAYAKRDEEIPWVRVNRLPGHVYFSHAAHVTLGKLDCIECHGDMKKQETALTRANIHLVMSDCIACHEKQGADYSCVACHK